ncbi:MAG: hypothetical protein JKX84_01310 [Flavobacteriales bacterium]|nr:hypothetical protein [Flavobacteriales bacterium]
MVQYKYSLLTKIKMNSSSECNTNSIPDTYPTISAIKSADKDFTESTVRSVEEKDDYYIITDELGFCSNFPKKYGVQPNAGDEIRCYNGNPTRGIDVNGVEVFYRHPLNSPDPTTQACAKVNRVLLTASERNLLEDDKWLLSALESYPMQFSGVEGAKKWQNVLHENLLTQYGSKVINSCYSWAKRMEEEVEGGKPLSEIAPKTFEEVSAFTELGRMEKSAVEILGHCWKYGGELHELYSPKNG